jgi:hypothetical protein
VGHDGRPHTVYSGQNECCLLLALEAELVPEAGRIDVYTAFLDFQSADTFLSDPLLDVFFFEGSTVSMAKV